MTANDIQSIFVAHTGYTTGSRLDKRLLGIVFLRSKAKKDLSPGLAESTLCYLFYWYHRHCQCASYFINLPVLPDRSTSSS